MTKKYLPTELGVANEGSPAGFEDNLWDDYNPDVPEVEKGEDPGVSTQPEGYKGLDSGVEVQSDQKDELKSVNKDKLIHPDGGEEVAKTPTMETNKTVAKPAAK